MCQCYLTINPFSLKMNHSTGSPTALSNYGAPTVITPHMGVGQNSETYLVGGRRLFPATRAKSIQAHRPNDFRSASIIAKNFT